jgi:hypothetical protein
MQYLQPLLIASSDSLRKGQRKLFVCSPSHEFIKTPPEGLEKIKDQKIFMNGTSISFVDWLAEVRKSGKRASVSSLEFRKQRELV